MKSHINPEYYHLPEVFKTEQEKIFKKVWNFVAFTYDLQNENDFVTLTIDSAPIVIQNFKGQIKAFSNICSHRFSLLQTEKKGNRRLFCHYHGWSYSSDGIPNGIPKKPLFKDYSKEELCKLKLKEFKVEICGSLVFINLNNNSPSLKEYLGKYYNELEALTNSFGNRIDVNPITIKSNWKIIIENTMEGYHNSTVHKNTLSQLVPVTSPDNLVFDFNHPHSNFIVPLLIKENSKKFQLAYRSFSNRSWKLDGYIHYLIFPNLLISTSYGVIFNVSIINPINADTTYFESNVFLSKLNDEHTEEDVKDLATTVIEYNRKVFTEDVDVCEAVQIGVKYTDQPGVLSLEELRVEQFQKDYLNFIK